MCALLGPGWDPVTALLQGMASVALDDRTSAAYYQGPAIRNLWQWHKPAGTLTTGSGNELVAYGGGTDIGYFRVVGENHRGSYTTSAGIPGMEWPLERGK